MSYNIKIQIKNSQLLEHGEWCDGNGYNMSKVWMIEMNQAITKGCKQYWKQHREISTKESDIRRNLKMSGKMYSNGGEYKKAQQAYKQREKKSFKTDSQRADNNNSLGSVYVNMGQYKKSLQYYHKCEQIRRKSLGIDHPSYAGTLNNIGLVYKNMGQISTANTYFQKAQLTKKSKY